MTRLAIVGIDGATYQIIRPLVAAGELPHIARVLRQGAWGVLESETPPITPPAWVSMMTGVNPGRHGIFHFIRRQLGSYQTPLNDASHFAGKDIHAVLGRRGWSVGSLAVPMTYPPQPQPGGYQVAGIPCPLDARLVSDSPETAAAMERVIGRPYRPDVDYAAYDGDHEPAADDLDQYQRLREELFAVERERLEVAKALLRERPTDFYFTVVSITDRCQHYFWKFQDRGHAGWTEEGARRYAEVIGDAYRLADEFVGAVREAVGEDCPVALVSDHGFGPQHGDFHANRWLEEQGFLVRRRHAPCWTLARTSVGAVLGKLGLAGLARLLGPLARIPLWRPWRKPRPDLDDVDWSRTQAYQALHGLCVNLEGREPLGCVPPAGFHAVLDALEARLGELRLPDGSAALDFCVRGGDFYRGPRAAEAPDLQYQMGGIAWLPKDDWDAAALFTPRRHAAISGTHRFDGVFAVSGPGVASRELDGMHIRDTTPTLLSVVDEPVPSWMEGRVLDGVLRSGRDPTFVEEDEPGVQAASTSYSDEQAAAIEESLRGLGYLQ
ncbi:MAG: alkaline phosphatase family protein [Planctomycetes bacterium]|nr:alkaline phosphatase family protein [Planctomycetota bacterium]MBL7008386.1 alkaline phosphatase family protein [Planctomycetota bacterium]